MPKRRARTKSNNDDDLGEPIIELRYDDILVGRGFQYESHPGNAIFHDAIEGALPEYMAAPTRKGKSEVVKRLFQQLSASTRFLRLEPSNGCYYRTSGKESKQKISHALRYKSQLEIDPESDAKLPATNPAASQENDGGSPPSSSVSSKPAFVSAPTVLSGQQRQDDENGENEFTPYIKRQKMDSDTSSIFSAGQLEAVLGDPAEYVVGTQESSESQYDDARQASTVFGLSHPLGNIALASRPVDCHAFPPTYDFAGSTHRAVQEALHSGDLAHEMSSLESDCAEPHYEGDTT